MDVIIIGANHHNTLGVLRSLGKAGIRSLLILISNEKRPYVSYSKYIKALKIINDESEIVSTLLALNNFKNERSKPVVIACADSVASYLDLQYDKLKDLFSLPCANKKGVISYYMNKEEMSSLARKIGLLVPKTEEVDIDDKSPNIDMPFPWIVKPLVSKFGKKSDIKRCYNQYDWEHYLEGKHCKNLQIQELIDKEYEFQLIGCSLNGGDKVVIPGYAKNIRPSDVTNTGYLQYIPTKSLPVDFSLCQSFIKKTGYSGLFSMEFIHGKDGKNYFMEINFRNDGNSICVTASGLNLPYLWCLTNNGYDINIEMKNIDTMRPVYVMPEFDDLILLIKGKVSIITWFRDFCKTDCFMEFSKKDIKPFFFALIKFLMRGFRYSLKMVGIIKNN